MDEDPAVSPLRRAEANRRGLSDSRLRRTHSPVFRGVHLPKNQPRMLPDRLRAALAVVTPGSFVSHHSAAQLWGAIVPDHPDVHVSSRVNRTRRQGITAHRAKKEQTVVRWAGFAVTSPTQTFLDMAHHLTLVDLVVLGDSLVRRKRTTPDALVSAAEGKAGPYRRLARRAASLVRRGVDSAMETRVRLLVVLAGLPEPEVDHRVYDAEGNLIRRYDLSYLPFPLILEYDGRQHAESTLQWQGDIDRDEALDDDGIRRLVIVRDGVYGKPGATLVRVMRAMRRAGMPVPPLKDEWRRHFPGRPGDVLQPR